MTCNSRRLFLNMLIIISTLLLAGISQVYAADVTVSDAYARAVPPGQPNSAAFMVLQNNSKQDRALVNARSNISKVVELHTHKKENGVMRMRRVDRIDVRAGSKTVLQPGGLHVMFIGLKQQLKAGDMVELELEFDDKSRVKLKIPVKMVAGMQMQHQHMHNNAK